MPTTIGIDPSIRHGAVYMATWENPGRHLVWGKNIYQWRAKDAISVGQKAPASALFHLAREISENLSGWWIPNDVMIQEVRPRVAIDWDSSAIFWRNQKIQVVTMALFLGYLTRLLHEQGFLVTFITPADVRRVLNVPKIGRGERKKEIVHQAFVAHLGNPVLPVLSEDEMDALILSYVLLKSEA